jgi:hypothetical protein
MLKNILYLALFLFPHLLSAQVISILSARSKPLGTVVTVRGIVTNGAELGKIRYLQDGTAGIAAFPGTGSAPGFETSVTAGDSIQVTGALTSFQGLLEITSISAYTVIASNRPLPAPRLLTFPQISDNFESQLIGLECVVFADGGGAFSTGVFDITDVEGSSTMAYFRSGHPLTGSVIPSSSVYLTGILSEFNDFQVLPRYASDFTPQACFYYTETLTQTSISTNALDLSWKTNLSATTKLRYGTTPAMGTTINVAGNATAQTYSLAGLQPGTIYWVQLESEHNGNVILSPLIPFATRSTSSGQVKVYFNHSIDQAYANGFSPDGQTSAAVLAETIARINAAQQTLDVAMYNNNRDDLTNALKNAHNRGVRVRYIAATNTASSALNPAPAFPVVYGNDLYLMHNKFLVIDADLTDKAWVMNGSLNWTDGNITNDFNNTLFVQDQSLARTFEVEFEEMWGSDAAQPNVQNSRFGASKTDNTPHRFIIGGIPVECWFSPSDHTTDRIVDAVHTAQSEALFATLSFTKNEIGDALVDVFNNNATVRGMIENISDPGAEIDYLSSIGIDCRPHPLTYDLHHKYGVFDANGSDPTVVTGSHNWTITAEAENDENILVLHDARLASLYKAEFEKRWEEISVDVTAPKNVPLRTFPNPVSDVWTLQMDADAIEAIEIRNVLGEVVFMEKYAEALSTKILNFSQLYPGYYFALIRTTDGFSSVPFQKI